MRSHLSRAAPAGLCKVRIVYPGPASGAAKSVVESAMKKSSRAKKASQAKQESQSVVVTVSGDRHIHEVARDLKASGLESAQVLDAINIVTGSVAPKSIEKLRKVRGVQDVSEDHPVSIGPPGAPIS
jgi:ribosomal protein S25